MVGLQRGAESAPFLFLGRLDDQAECQFYLIFDLLKLVWRQCAERLWVEKRFFQCGDLIALRPAVDVQAAFPFCEWHPHAELGALDASDGDNADVEGVTIEAIGREDEDGAVFIQTG